MKKTFLVLCIIALALLGLSALLRMTATADSDFAIGNLSKIAEELGVVPEEAGKYSLASILEALYASIENANKQASDLETTITKLSSSISSLQVEVHSIRQEAVGVNSDRLNEFISWTERELNNLWGKLNSFNVESRLQQIEGQLRDQSGRNLDYRLSQMESRIQQIEWTLQGIQSSNSNDYRLQQIEWKLNDLQNQINSLRR
jgi:peptidoglycan hydrolase CwlO-like protein